MKVICTLNDYATLAQPVRQLLAEHGFRGQVECIEVGSEYEVFGILFRDDNLYYLVQDRCREYPMFVPCQCFALISNEVPSNWSLTIRDSAHGGSLSAFLWLNEFANRPGFFDALTDCESWALDLWKEVSSGVSWPISAEFTSAPELNTVIENKRALQELLVSWPSARWRDGEVVLRDAQMKLLDGHIDLEKDICILSIATAQI